MYDPNKRSLDLTRNRGEGEKRGLSFLMRRGLKRDRANYVSCLIRYKAELDQLLRMTTDATVKEELRTMGGFVTETIELMYTLESMEGDRG